MTMEKIAGAAIRVGNEVFVGSTHFAAMRRIVEMPGVDPATVADMIMRGEDGFVTDTGRFVSRSEAFQIASEQGQLAHTELADPERNKAFYSTPEPSLDSGMMEGYAPLRIRPSYLC